MKMKYGHSASTAYYPTLGGVQIGTCLRKMEAGDTLNGMLVHLRTDTHTQIPRSGNRTHNPRVAVLITDSLTVLPITELNTIK